MLLGAKLNAEHTDALRLQSHDFIRGLVGRVSHRARTIFSGPHELILCHLLVVLVVSQTALSYLDISIAAVVRRVHALDVLLQIKHWGLSGSCIEEVSHVFDADKHLHAVKRNQVDLEVTIEVGNLGLTHWARIAELSRAFSNVEVDRLINCKLNLAL